MKMKQEKSNIGIALDIQDITKNQIRLAISDAKKNNLPIKVKVKDYQKVYEYLLNRERRRENRVVALKALSKPLLESVIKLRKRFVEALSSPVPSEYHRDFGYLISNEAISKCNDIINYLNFRAPGQFEEYVDFDEKRRGGYVKFNLLLLDHEKKLAIIQGRQYLQWKSVEHSTSRHNYYLVGLTEEGRTFTHPIPGQIAWRLVELWDRNKDWYDAFLRWAFKVDDSSRIIRQGDVALIELKKKPVGLNWTSQNKVKINNSHEIHGDVMFAQNGEKHYIIVPNDSIVTLVHLRNQHATIQIKPGIYRIGIARSAALWDFSGRVVD